MNKPNESDAPEAIAERLVTAIEGNFRDWLMSGEHAEARELCAGILREELGRLEGERDQAKKQAAFAWRRHAEKDAAYGAALAERDAFRAEVERLNSLVKDPQAMHVNILRHMPGYRLMPDEYLVRLNSQIATRDEALKVAGQALGLSADCFNRISHGDEEITCGQAESLLNESRSALRRIEELTKGEGP